MKKLLKSALVFLMFISTQTYAQESIMSEINNADLQKYIALAKENYPRRKIFATSKEIVKIGVPMAQLSYLDMVSASYFYRPGERQVLDPLNPYTVNGVQFGISASLGTLLSKPFQVKRAKAEYKIAQLQEQEFDTQLTNMVKSRYYDYILQLRQLKINTQSAQDSKGVAESLRNKFEKGEITLETYNQSRSAQYSAENGQIQGEISFLKAKDSLEEVIGIKLTEVK